MQQNLSIPETFKFPKVQYSWIAYVCSPTCVCAPSSLQRSAIFCYLFLRTTSGSWKIFILRIPWKWVHSEHILPVGTVVMRTDMQCNTKPFYFLTKNAIGKEQLKNEMNCTLNSMVVYSYEDIWIKLNIRMSCRKNLKTA